MAEEKTQEQLALAAPPAPTDVPVRHSVRIYLLVWLGWGLMTTATVMLSIAYLPLLVVVLPLQGLPLCLGLGQRGARRRIALRWTIAGLVGEILGLVPAIGVSYVTIVIALVIYGDPYNSPSLWTWLTSLGPAGLAFSFALVASTLQWRLIRPWFRVSGCWVWANALNWAVAALIGTSIIFGPSPDQVRENWPVGPAVAGAIAGLAGGGLFLLLLYLAEKKALPTEKPADILGLLRFPAQLVSFLRTEFSPRRRGQKAVRRLTVLFFLAILLISAGVSQGLAGHTSRGILTGDPLDTPFLKLYNTFLSRIPLSFILSLLFYGAWAIRITPSIVVSAPPRRIEPRTRSPFPKRCYSVDGAHFKTLEGFYEEISRKLTPDATWAESLDGFRCILQGGFGTPTNGFVLVWQHSALSRERLGYAETVRQLEKQLADCPDKQFRLQLEQAQSGQGPTVFDWVVDIIRERPEIELVLD